MNYKGITLNLITYFLIWLDIIHVNISRAAQFTVYSSSSSMIVNIGKDAILSCYLEPEMSAVDMEIRWIRADDGSIVYKYRKGVEETPDVNNKYYRRTEMIKDGIERGNVSMKIRDVQVSDKGLYTCYYQSDYMFDEARIEILPQAIGKSPSLLIETEAPNFKVSCSSSGWYPKPVGQWLSGDKQSMTMLRKSIAETEDGLYNITISSIFTKESQGITCAIQNTYSECQRQVSIHLSESLFPVSNAGHIAAHVILSVIILGFVIVYILNERRKRKKKEFKQAIKHTADVRLDPDTAHPDLKVSDDLKCLSRAEERQDVPDNEKRFDTRLYVHGKDVLSNNGAYWKVNVKDANHWTIGVAKQNINRKGNLNLSTREGYWVLELNDGRYQVYTDQPKMKKNVKGVCNIGIYVHSKKLQIDFYDADKSQLIHSFNKNLEKNISLYPFFSVWTQGEKIHVCSQGCPHCAQTHSDEEAPMLLGIS
ncbi:hypothetical protein GDO81_020221 [Engystomops pustulosus]|uniref:Butyrophilin subfamily 1 member A1-like n=1 Tax=Engystomops pustulosus TaxID=76066 RepID=A0AAV6ZKH4_ENGPU|nr:hypothetical protein GDO81_020221 [Engystomops pustulosus]